MIENIVETIGEDKLREIARLPKNFDLKLVDFEHGFRAKVEPIIPISLMSDELSGLNVDAYNLLIKAGVYYSLVLDIPKIKVHLSNYGISQHEQQKAKNAAWWDVRDLGLSWLKKADECLLQGLFVFGKLMTAEGKKRIPFFRHYFPWVEYERVNAVYPVSSAEAFLKLSQLMKDAFDALMVNFPSCSSEEFMSDERLAILFSNYVLYKAMCTAMELPHLSFLTRGIVVQYEELPWQKSSMLSGVFYENTSRAFAKLCDGYLEQIWEYLRIHGEKFPCYASEGNTAKVDIVRGKGGVYL